MHEREGLKHLPSVDSVVRHLDEAGLLRNRPRPLVVRAVRRALAEARSAILAGDGDSPAPVDVREDVLTAAGNAVAKLGSEALRPVINATGVIVHTNLGRAPLSSRALSHMVETSRGYSNLEYEVGEGTRGHRDLYVREALCELTGAEDALVTNNNAAAVLLALNTLALGREVVVSRSELIEIGGSFRLPDVFERSGARMVAVGTTNRTHPSDFERAVTNRTAALMAAHWSNYSIVGFVEQVQLRELAAICERRGLPLLHDLGSGILPDAASLGLSGEMTLAESLSAGASVVTASGDKMLGGPQAGIVLGKRDIVEAMRVNPLMRALRPGKLTLAALQVTLEHYLDGSADRDVPVLRALLEPTDALRDRAESLRTALSDRAGEACSFEIVDTVSRVGGGAAPERAVPSVGLALDPVAMSPDSLAERLRLGDPPVVARTVDGRVVLDLRTVFAEQDPVLLDAVAMALESER